MSNPVDQLKLASRFLDASLYFREDLAVGSYNNFISRNKNVFRNIISLYETKDRVHYHGPQHLLKMLNALDQIQAEAGNRLTKKEIHTIELAIFYHDVVLLPGSRHNEESSVEWMKSQWDEGSKIMETLEPMILASKHTTNSETDLLTQIFLDLDLWGMGDDFEEFYDTTARIRAEFAHVDDMEFLKNRVRFIDSMINRVPIFYNPMGLNSLYAREPQAVTNLTQERQQFSVIIDTINHLNRYISK